MSFVDRKIVVQFTDPNIATVRSPNNGGNAISFGGLKCAATIINPGGSSAYGTLHIKIYGLTLEFMNEYSSVGANMVAIQQRGITVSAGDGKAEPFQVFSGTIISSYIDFSSAPDVSFVVDAVSGYYAQAVTVESLQLEGSANAEDLIQSIATTNGFTFTNAKSPNNAHFIVQNQYISGSAIEQMSKLAALASFPMTIENNGVYIWANMGVRDTVIVDVNSSTDLVGYPSYWASGLVVKQEFNSNNLVGRIINLKSIIPKANGKWPIQTTTHELSTVTTDGPWFTTSKLSPQPYVSNNN